ncbi:Methyltransferase domain-containing protein [Streptomyces sp. DI166]|uniref:methyltransferase domain-containing protein n=1 Tax=Streptomyces sp. DI166 TaxID=1839783 RepID=UPI0007F52195|nr:methyltransferase domain-containing protein [Streptomyces sp. DI166]SBT88978.1 Methyltransferase domain-containing protein [Streptomyces sp. DI166]
MPDYETQNLDTWTAYGAHQLTRDVVLPELDQWAWTITGVGPGSEVLEEVRGLRVLELGSGLGRHAASVAAMGASVTAVDSSPTQHQRAVARYPGTPGLHLVCADAVAHLSDADPYDLIYSVSAVHFTDPCRLLPALAQGLKPGGRFVFSVLHTNSRGDGPSDAVIARPEALRLPGTDQELPGHMWVLTPQLWEGLLAEHGLVLDSVTAIDAPEADNRASYRLYVSHRTAA